MKTPKSFYILALLVFVLSAGMKCKDELTFKPNKEELPRATQEGRNTFGCLINGKLYIPKRSFLRVDFDLSYDPNYKGGALGIIANRINSDDDRTYLSIGGSGINKTGKYLFSQSQKNVGYSTKGCEYIDNVITTGWITITRLDLANNVIAGTFEFKLEKNGCETISVTEGRFDMKI